MHHRAERRLYLRPAHLGPVDGEHQPRAVRRKGRAARALLGAGRNVVSVLQVAVAARCAQNYPAAQFLLAVFFLTLGLLGGYVHWSRDRKTFWYFGPLMFTMTLALIYYLNFKYGWSQAPGLEVAREVRDRDYFYIWSFSAWGVWAAIGFAFLWEQLAYILGGEKRGEDTVEERRQNALTAGPSRRGFMLAAPILALALIPLVVNWNSASRANHYFTQEWARDYLNSLEPYAIVITNGDN